MEGWIKLHRKILDNEIILDDSAYKLFTILLMLVNRKTGKYTAGRYQLAEITGLKPGTVYDALHRLEKKYKMATLAPNSRFTTISITNWKQYQDSPTPSPTSAQHLTNTKQEVKNKEYDGGFSKNTKIIADLLGVAPTKGLERYANDTYKDYILKPATIHCVQWCEDNKIKPTTSRWMNWIRRAEKGGELERRNK